MSRARHAAPAAIALVLAVLSGLWVSAASALEFEVRFSDNRPFFTATLWVDMTGEIRPGDTERFLAAIRPYAAMGATDMVLNLDSPGGNLVESMRLGRAISELNLVTLTNVGIDGAPGICASACVNVYLGADYRYLSDGSRIGVHRFSMEGTEAPSDEIMSISQSMSAQIIEHIQAMRADPAFFSIMVSAHARDIYWVPRRTLEDMRVVTYGIFEELVEYRNVNGSIALHMNQVSRFGENALTLVCGDRGLVGVFDLNEPEFASVAHLDLYIDGSSVRLPDFDVIDRRMYRFKAIAAIPSHVLARLADAGELGANVVTANEDLMFGFQEGVRDPRISEMARGCQASLQAARPRMIREDGLDLTGGDLTRSGHRDVSFERCQSICLDDRRCVAVSYVVAQRWCWPKGRIDAVVPRSGVVSAWLE